MELWAILLILIGLVALNYLNLILQENIIQPFVASMEQKEGFEDGSEATGATDESNGMIRYLDNSQLYDSFYASVYDQLTQGSVRTQAEIGLLLHEWTKRGADLKTFEVLDGGCGTGIAAAALAKMNVKRVVGMDTSKAMLAQAATTTLQQSTLTDEQKNRITWKQADLLDPSANAGGSFTHALLLYFTIYYFVDKESVFRNLYFWVKPGGRLAIHVVNKHKFDPMLESAAPWIGFSLQKYSKSRVTKSEVAFNKFTYSAEFDLQDPLAEFRETFRFKDGKVRRQRHTFKMEDMNEIVGMAKAAGWEYLGYTDLTPVSFEYAYHLHFKHP